MESLKFESLEWDSEKLGVSCGRIICNDISDESDLTKLLNAFKRLIYENRGVDFITIKLPSAFHLVADGLVKSCARLIDTELVFKLNKTGNSNVSCEVHIVNECDPECFTSLAEEMVCSRFFLDPEISRIKARELWISSIRNYCLGRADRLAVAYWDGYPRGLVTLEFEDDKKINLHIVGVLKEFQGRGIGRSMLTKIANNFGGEFDIFVEASSMNVQAIKSYQKSGFILDSMYYILHVWSGRNENKTVVT